MNSIHLKVTALTEEARRGLSTVEREQFPFALAKTLTDVASMAVKAVQKRTRQQFDLHSEFIPRGIARTRAKKADVKNTGMGTTVVFTKPIISGWMPVHETGGARKASAHGERDKGRYLAIPATDLLQRSYRTGTGKVRRRWAPSTLLQSYAKTRNVSMSGGLVRPTRGGRKGKPFIIRGRGSGVPMIVRRKGKGRYPLELLYMFSKRAKYKRVWRFEQTVSEIVDRRFFTRLKRNLQIAVRTAR